MKRIISPLCSQGTKKWVTMYKNKYRITSARAPFWDYRWNAAYFVTICTHNRKCWFGDVIDGVMETPPKPYRFAFKLSCFLAQRIPK